LEHGAGITFTIRELHGVLGWNALKSYASGSSELPGKLSDVIGEMVGEISVLQHCRTRRRTFSDGSTILAWKLGAQIDPKHEKLKGFTVAHIY